MSVTTVAHRLVDLCKDSLDQQAVDELYSNDIVSVECGEQVMRTEGMPGLHEKMQWWYNNHEALGCKSPEW